MQGALQRLDAVDLESLHALSCRKPNVLFGCERRQARTPESTCMDVNIRAAIFRHHKAETLLIIEEFDFALDHRAGRPGIARRGKAIPATEPIPATEAISAPEAIAALVAVAATKSVAATEVIAAAAEPVAATAKAIAPA